MLLKVTGAVAGLLAAVSAGSTLAATQVDLSSSFDQTLVSPVTQVYPNLGAIQVGGVVFNTSNQDNALQVIAGTPSADTVTITTDIADTAVAYTLINSGGGTSGDTTGSVTFQNAAGDTETFNLTEGVNVRDHYDGTFVNSATDLYGTYDTGAAYPSSAPGERLDAQEFNLGATFAANPLTSITFSDFGQGLTAGEPFLAAVTVSGVPEPATWAVMLFGAGIIGGVIRSRRRSDLIESAS